MPSKPQIFESPFASNVYGLTLAGGASTRLFPFNKVLSDLTGSGRSLIQQTFDRVTAESRKGPRRYLLPVSQFYVITEDRMVLPIKAQLNIPSAQFLVDPKRRGTWPAILWAMAHLRQEDPEAVLAIVTSDHIIPDVGRFREGFIQAAAWARQRNAFVLLGVKPTRRPEDWVGFGSLRLRSISGSAQPKARPTSAFEEKPSPTRAAAMIAETGWVWNAGMFFFRISVAERALYRFQPAMAEIYEEIFRHIQKGNSAKARAVYARYPAKIQHPADPTRTVDNTIDYAILPHLVAAPSEDAALFAIANALPGWADVGEWVGLEGVLTPDPRGNLKLGRVTADSKTTGCILAADRGITLDARGLCNAVVASSNDTVFLFPKFASPSVRTWVQEIHNRPKEKVLMLESAQAKVTTNGGRVAVCGLRGLEIHWVKNRLRVVGPSTVL